MRSFLRLFPRSPVLSRARALAAPASFAFGLCGTACSPTFASEVHAPAAEPAHEHAPAAEVAADAHAHGDTHAHGDVVPPAPVPTPAPPAPAAPAALSSVPTVRPQDAAFTQLMAGNARFVLGRPLHANQTEARREEVAKGQHPIAIVLTCADSRVGPELVFDQGLGDLFVVRNAGHVLDAHVVGSIEYAVAHLGAPLIVVMGHERCGAVGAAVAGGDAEGHVWDIVQSLQPAVIAARGQEGDRVDNAVRLNSQLAAKALSQSNPILTEAVRTGRLMIVATRYDLDSGSVELLRGLPAEAPPAHAGH